MSLDALAGLAFLNVLFALCGAAQLWWVRGWATSGELARLAGLAYLLGVATVGTLWTLLLIVGVPLSLWVAVAVPSLATLVCIVLARRSGRDLPRIDRVASKRGLLATAVGIAAAAVFFEALFRAFRLSGLQWWDAWSFWVPKAKAVYFFGDLDVEFFTTLPGSSYPPLVPVLDAAAFRFMASPDVVTLHAQYWLLGVGFVWGLAGLLAERVPAWLLWPFMLLLLVAPRIGRRMPITEADLLLDYLFVLAAILVLFWVVDGERWRLLSATVLMCGMVLTKREGLLLAGLIVLAGLVVTARRWRASWPGLGLTVLIVAAVAAPWRIWYVAHGVAGEGPETGGLDPTENAERLWPSLRLAFDVLFSSNYWSVLVPVMVGALILAAFARAFTPVVFLGVLVAVTTLGGGWIVWAVPELPLTQELGGNPIVRYMGSAALLCAAASPLLLSATWSAVTRKSDGGAA